MKYHRQNFESVNRHSFRKLDIFDLDPQKGSLDRYGKNLLQKVEGFEKKFPKQNFERGLERALFRSRWVRPNFASCWLISKPPLPAELCMAYNVAGTKVNLFTLPEGAESLYHIEPFEYFLPRAELCMIEDIIKRLESRIPVDIDLKQYSEVNEFIERYCIYELKKYIHEKKISLGLTRTEEELQITRLAGVIRRYTGGLGLIEVLLSDRHVQDIYIDAPVDDTILYISTGRSLANRLSSKFVTNIRLTQEAAEGLTARFRYESNRPFSSAYPVLECDNRAFNTRVTIIGPPISPRGTAFALRRHSHEPWTLPALIAVNSLTAEAAGLISFLLDGQSTMLIAGGRGAGKSSLLGAILFEFPPATRILTIEDTLELPCTALQKLGYKVQSMHIQSGMRGTGNITANEALRVSLRLGESAIVLGEVRGAEAKTLYEAMRAGTAGSAVLGTFHAESAKAVYERVVYDMDISSESFSSTDIVIIAGLNRPSGVQHGKRRVTQIAELCKNTDEPGHFEDLMSYSQGEDLLLATARFLKDSERLTKIGEAWNMDYSSVLSNIRARGAMRQAVVDHFRTCGRRDILTGRWVSRCNSMFWELLQKQAALDADIRYDELLSDWKNWFKKAVHHG